MHENKKNRWEKWNYSYDGFYFITICTKDRYPYFGKIETGNMILNDVGKIINDNFYKTFEHYDYCYCDEFVIMPNHIHMTLVIDYDLNDININRSTDAAHPVGVARVRHLRDRDRSKMYLSKIIHGFKSSCTKQINIIKPFYFKWQKSFHDHIIRNENEYFKIKYYIKNNPKLWGRDRNNLLK